MSRLSSRPRVYARLRPLNENEMRMEQYPCFSTDRGQSKYLVYQGEGTDRVKTEFDYVFDTATTQKDVFNQIGVEVLNTLFHGYNASVFAYGQTGSGKTHTMEGDNTGYAPELRGLIPRVIETIFQRLDEIVEKHKDEPNLEPPNVQCSFVQIYNEKIQDLFNARKTLDIHRDKDGHFIAQGAQWRTITDVNQALSLFIEASKQRATSATEMNLVSSRSHTILMIKALWDEPSLPGLHAQLNLVDLAGSEKLYQSGATGDVMKEAININKSLSALGNVVSKLVDAAKHPNRRFHIPYRDSKLTYLLQSSLGGKNLVHFILAMSSSSAFKTESQATVEFGKRALQLVLRPEKNSIDCKRLEEMEAMIDKLRDRIRMLEGDLDSKNNAGFLQLKQLGQEGERRKKPKRASTKAQLRSKTELNRIIANLPETLEDLTSHCVLFPSSRSEFRALGGIEKLVHFIDKSPSTFYKAHAAHTVAHVVDDDGRDIFGECGGMEAVAKLLLIPEERCKEAACVAIEAVVRNYLPNKKRLPEKVYGALAELIYGYPNQQVQEAACTALAAIVDTFPDAKAALRPHDILRKLINTIRDSPPEIVHVTKAATTCIGRLAHKDAEMQGEIERLGGIRLLIDNVLFNPVGERDHQVPILASYALVNICCSNEANMASAQRHPKYEEVRFRLMEGLARAFGNNTMQEGYGRATCQELSTFPYYGVTIIDKWTGITSGGRPIFSTFMENPQFHLYVKEDTTLSIMIQDVLYESRMQQKQRNNTVYMGIAVFQGNEELANAGLKQLDFHGKMTEIAKFTSNCENVLHCTLKQSKVPYVVVPFTSQRGKTTTFALSAFADKEIEFTSVPETTGWVRSVVQGCWNAKTGRGGENFDWRNNPQVQFTARSNTKAVFVLSYLSLDEQRAKKEEVEEEPQVARPRLHGRIFTNNFAPDMRYLKALVPLPQHSSFVGTNSFSSNSYVTTTASLSAGQTYTYVPFTEIPFEDTWRLCVYSDNDDLEIAPLGTSSSSSRSADNADVDNSSPSKTKTGSGTTAAEAKCEWTNSSYQGTWDGDAARLSLSGPVGTKVCAIITSKDTFLRVSIYSPEHKKLGGIDSFWNGEANVEHTLDTASTVVLAIEGMVRNNGAQKVASEGNFDVCIFTTKSTLKTQLHFTASESSLPSVISATSTASVEYPRLYTEAEADPTVDEAAWGGENEMSGDEYESDSDSGGGAAAVAAAQQMQEQLEQTKRDNEKLQRELQEKDAQMTLLRKHSLTLETMARGGHNVPGGNAYQPPRTASSHSQRGDMYGGPPGSRQGSRRLNQRPSINTRGPSLGGGIGGSAIELSGRGLDSEQQFGGGSVVAQEVYVSLMQVTAQDKPPSAAEWIKIKQQLKNCQQRLQHMAAGIHK